MRERPATGRPVWQPATRGFHFYVEGSLHHLGQPYTTIEALPIRLIQSSMFPRENDARFHPLFEFEVVCSSGRIGDFMRHFCRNRQG